MRISKDGKRGMTPQQLKNLLSAFPAITAGETEDIFKAYKDTESGELNDINAKGHEIENKQ